jgi:uncharacterized short protein YbdD (DUF466 family)
MVGVQNYSGYLKHKHEKIEKQTQETDKYIMQLIYCWK